jgi:MauM/NapG family ferredoxin protein
MTLAGACVGYPLLLWLDPLALLGASLDIFHDRGGAGSWWLVLGLAGVLLISLLWPGLWCVRLCPLGATQDLLADASGRCKRVVARGADPAPSPSGWAVPRRLVLGSAVGVAWGLAVRSTRAGEVRSLRPPGVVEETLFSGLCIRCGNCTRACPANIIQPDIGKLGIADLLTPVIDYSDDYCREDCIRCTEVCPSGALTRVKLADKITTVIGVPRVDMESCLLGDDRECSICRNRCPFEAISLEFCEIEYTLTPRVDLSRCPGCGACEVACPTTPEKAITVVPSSVFSG